MILATDEVYTYAIFNYIQIRWSSHTEAGGDTTGGEGGVPAYVSKAKLFNPLICFHRKINFLDWIQCWKRHSSIRIRTVQSIIRAS